MKYSARFALLALGSAIALAACGDSGTADADGDGNITADEMREEMARDGANLRPDPGNYKVTMTLSKAEIPGAPPEMMDMMGSMMNNTFEYCLTPEEAEKGFEEALTEGQDESCKIEQFNLDGGKIEMAMSCSPAEGGDMRMTMNGNVSSTKSDINVVTQGNIAGMGEANIEMSMVQERIGDCEG